MAELDYLKSLGCQEQSLVVRRAVSGCEDLGRCTRFHDYDGDKDQ